MDERKETKQLKKEEEESKEESKEPLPTAQQAGRKPAATAAIAAAAGTAARRPVKRRPRETRTRQDDENNDHDDDEMDLAKLLELRNQHDDNRVVQSHREAATTRPTLPTLAATQTAPAAVFSRDTKVPRTLEQAAVTPGAYSMAPGQDLVRNQAARYSVLARNQKNLPQEESTPGTCQDNLQEEEEEESTKLSPAKLAPIGPQESATNDRESQE